MTYLQNTISLNLFAKHNKYNFREKKFLQNYNSQNKLTAIELYNMQYRHCPRVASYYLSSVKFAPIYNQQRSDRSRSKTFWLRRTQNILAPQISKCFGPKRFGSESAQNVLAQQNCFYFNLQRELLRYSPFYSAQGFDLKTCAIGILLNNILS